MPDIEKVIKGFEYCEMEGDCKDCPYYGVSFCMDKRDLDALELLKSMQNRPENANRCVCCGAIIPEGRQVCPQCAK